MYEIDQLQMLIKMAHLSALACRTYSNPLLEAEDWG